MKNLKNYFLTFLLLSFLLPFVPPGCSDMSVGKEKVESEQGDIAKADSAISKSDTISKIDSNAIKAKQTELTSDKQDSIEYHPFDTVSLAKRIFMSPDRDHLSGTGYLIEYFVLEYFLVFLGFLIPFIVLVQSLLKRRLLVPNDKILLVVGVLLLSIVGILHYDILVWGFWVSLGLYSVTIISFFISKDE